jgi:hypothetical protein
MMRKLRRPVCPESTLIRKMVKAIRKLEAQGKRASDYAIRRTVTCSPGHVFTVLRKHPEIFQKHCIMRDGQCTGEFFTLRHRADSGAA